LTAAGVTSHIRVGCAGWAIRREHAQLFPDTGSHLERYTSRFPCVEINSSFYRPHRPATYARWAATVPQEFRFSVKMPRTITHEDRLIGVEEHLARFAHEIAHLGERLGPVLVQLPPGLAFDDAVAREFLAVARTLLIGTMVLEPRHPTWFSDLATELLLAHGVARVAADPACGPGGSEPAGWSGIVYYRLHGAPRIYHSEYDTAFLDRLADALRVAAVRAETWCIFDNTARGHATTNAMRLRTALSPQR
jgi:uncharacterized protein YecE (DUF72 family)